MLYNEEKKNEILEDLENKCISLACNIEKVSSLGFNVQNNSMLLQLNSILYNAFESIDVFSKEQHRKLENIYNSLSKYE